MLQSGIMRTFNLYLLPNNIKIDSYLQLHGTPVSYNDYIRLKQIEKQAMVPEGQNLIKPVLITWIEDFSALLDI